MNSYHDILIKETCFGCLVEGPSDKIRDIIKFVRELDPHNIFTRKRGFYIGDPRICRNLRQGGQKLGFNFLEFEYRFLNTISTALSIIESEQQGSVCEKKGRPKKKKVDSKIISELIDDLK